MNDPMQDLLRRFRDFVVAKPGANHHHPIWAEVAEALSRRLVWICSGCDGRVPATLLKCPACASGIEEHEPGLMYGEDDPTARHRARLRGQASYRNGPDYTTWRCVECMGSLVSQYEPCPSCSAPAVVQRCRVCGCTTYDCSQCVARTGKPCRWIEDDLCSACVPPSIDACKRAVFAGDRKRDLSVHPCRCDHMVQCQLVDVHSPEGFEDYDHKRKDEGEVGL